MKNYLSFEFVVAVFKYKLKYLVVVIKDLIEHLYFKPRFQNLKNLCVLNLHGIVSEFHRVETSNSFKN